MILILTGTINPSLDVTSLTITDYKVRFKQYLECLSFYIQSGAFDKIIFCDNSGFDLSKFSPIQETATIYGVKLELISFKGDSKKVILKGKGYGEGEILEYIMRNSNLILDEKFFFKITGRLIVNNINSITKKVKDDINYFNIPNRNFRNMVDTRIYAMPVTIFKGYFLQTYHAVNDYENYFLEHAYTKTIQKSKLDVMNFPLFPRISGISGSTGNTYSYNEFRCKIKDILSYFNAYSLK